MMKNLGLLNEDLQEIVANFVWTCGGCGQSNLRASVTAKGSVQLHCYSCGRTIFCNDAEIFRGGDPFTFFSEEKPVAKKMKSGGTTLWYPKARVRIFVPEKP